METNKITNETPIVMLTVGQLMELLNKDKKQEAPALENSTNYDYFGKSEPPFRQSEPPAEVGWICR